MITEKHYSGVTVFDEKNKFSMIDERVKNYLRGVQSNGRYQIVLYGCEAHICMKQTAFDLLKNKGDFEVFIVVDATTSMSCTDRNVGLQTLRDAGCYITTFQQVVFDLIKTSEHPQFKNILKVLKDGTDPAMPLDLVMIPQHMEAWQQLEARKKQEKSLAAAQA